MKTWKNDDISIIYITEKFQYNSLTWIKQYLKAFFQKQWKKKEPQHDRTNKMSVRPAKTQISLGIRPVWSESSLCA